MATLTLVLLLPQIPRDETVYVALVVISAIRSIGTGIHTPAANATVPQLVEEEHLMKFNGVNATVQSVVQSPRRPLQAVFSLGAASVAH